MKNPTLAVAKECRLSGIPQALLQEIKKKLTLTNPKYRDAVKYGRWIGKNLKKELHFYTMVGETICFPRGFGNESVRICRNHGIRLQIEDQRKTRTPQHLRFHGNLRPYQEKAVNSALARDFGVLEAATGSGKTVMAAALIAQRSQPALILIHTKELLYQWQERIRTFLEIDPGLMGDGHNQIQPVTIGLIHTVRKHLDTLPESFGHIIIDEAHRTPSSMFTEIIKEFDCKFMLGLSATPFRRDGLTELIHWYIGDLVCRVSENELNRNGAVLKPRIIQRETSFSYRYRGNYQDLMAALTTDNNRNCQIADDVTADIRKHDGTALIVSDRIEHCEALTSLLKERNVKTATLTGRVPGEERNSIVNAVRNGEIQALVATIQLIGEGFDCSGLTSLFLSTPIKFSGRLTQVIGRILRPAEGKQPTVYDYIDPVGVLKSSAQARQLTYEKQNL
ncbi:MAG: DEAD/DEAH box helicase [Desulfobulbaceae bacterium]|uniref:DEAD/DEAH box helicase n=1 Tax=Candidatus Desulfobia pelagia TaxID=2841692 RepID=A0A8J6TGD8_9BACT|nr:DEAD/DEAH box helicase [Candidatus Desulfobia pelagia]